MTLQEQKAERKSRGRAKDKRPEKSRGRTQKAERKLRQENSDGKGKVNRLTFAKLNPELEKRQLWATRPAGDFCGVGVLRFAQHDTLLCLLLGLSVLGYPNPTKIIAIC
jgi:hypothetical protein